MYRLIFLGLLLSCYLAADEWSGIEYAQNSSVQLSHAERLLTGLSFTGEESVLDVGCGDGKITALVAKKAGIVIGIDPSGSMLERAEIARQESGLSNLSFQCGSAEDFSLEQQFDHIIAIHVMHWIKEQEKALINIHSHLKPHGHVHFILAPSKEGLPFHRALQKTVKNWAEDFADFSNPQQVYDVETYRRLMVQSGFHIEAIHYVYHVSTHETKEKLAAWIKQWHPHVKFLPANKQTDFLNELLDQYLLEMGLDPAASGPVKWGEYVLFVDAKKS